jgi:putative glutamine amidotransferase
MERIEEQLGTVDGLLFTGSAENDVDPEIYGQERHSATLPADQSRDRFELALIVMARERRIPVLAICRGAQIANVAFGGTLTQHIPDHVVSHVAHAIPHKRGLIDEHVIHIEAPSTLYDITKRRDLQTGSQHHQAVETVADDLRVVARTADGVIEALEARFASEFWLAVQWHPEATFEKDDESRAIFAHFVGSSRGQTNVDR